MLNKNKNYPNLKSIDSILRGGSVDNADEFTKNLTPTEMNCFKYAPVVSCDVERIFSKYKTVLADNRRSFNFENLKAHLVIKCNVNNVDEYEPYDYSY